MNIQTYQFEKRGDNRGCLVALEEFKEIPFKIRRVYYIYGNEANERRGFHAHKNLQQILVCVHGSCKIHLDDGKETTEILLNSPTKGLYIAHNLWREMYDFSEGAVLLVLASELYNESDYIRDYKEFLKYITKVEA